jgi:hypothetical protein
MNKARQRCYANSIQKPLLVIRQQDVEDLQETNYIGIQLADNQQKRKQVKIFFQCTPHSAKHALSMRY